MEQPALVRHMQQIARQHDLQALHREIIQALEAVPEYERPHVPRHLAKALDQFIDSYGPNRQTTDSSEH